MASPLLLTLAVFLLSPFSIGFQSLTSLSFLQNVLVCVFIQQAAEYDWKKKIGLLVLFYLALTLGSAIGFLGIFNNPDWTVENCLSVVAVTAAVVLIIMFAIVLAILLEPHLSLHPNLSPLRLFVFPILFTAFTTFYTHVSPLGAWSHHAYTYTPLDPLYQFVSFGGLASVTFIVYTLASLVSRLIVNSSYIAHDPRPAIVCLVVLFFVIVHGDVRRLDPSRTFFQKSVEYTVPTKIQASCLFAISDIPSTIYDRTEAHIIRHKPDLVLWSEGAVYITNAMEEAYLSRMSNISAQYQTVIGATYITQDRNMFALFRADGSRAFRYQKAHPVPFVEKGIIPGKDDPPVATVEGLGKVGGSICFDYDFPQFINKAGKKGANLMLQPSETWGPLRELHADMAATRAIENGFTVFRCSSLGVSGVFTPFHKTWAMAETLDTGDLMTTVPLFPQTHTLYSIGGEWFGFLTIALSVLLIIAVLYDIFVLHQRRAILGDRLL